MSGALADVLVLDATSEFWASLAAALLGDFGARVIRIDDVSNDGRGQPSWDEQYELANRNKLSLAISQDAPEGRDILEQLISKADVFITDAPLRVAAANGLDYASLARLKQDLVYARGSGFGPKGPDRDRVALDELAAARTGLMPILPQPGQPPVYTGAGQMYTSVMLAFGVVTALWHRDATGEGQEVDASLFAGNMYGASLDIQAFLAMGGERFLHPVSRLDAGNPMSGTLYPTQDGRWVTLTMPDTDRWWPGLAEITEIDPGDPRFDSHEKRCETNRLELIEVLERAFQQRPAEQWRRRFSDLQLSADVIEDYSYPAEDEQALRNGFILELEHPSFGRRKTLGFPLFMSDTPARWRRMAPWTGQHSAEVLAELLGKAEDEIVRLQDAGVVA